MAVPTLLRTDLSALDRDIAHALVSLRLARATARRCPGPRTAEGERRAEATLNALLDERSAVQQRPGGGPR